MKTKILTLIGFLLWASMASAQLVVGFNLTRGGTYNLQNQTTLQNSITAAMPSASFVFTGALDTGLLLEARGVVIMSPIDNINPISALTTSEQTALLNFVKAGGFAIIATDAGYIPSFDVTNASFLNPFGLVVTGTDQGSATVINPTGNPISNGPFGLVTSLTGIAAGPYSTVPVIYNPLIQLSAGAAGGGYFAPGALSANSGAVLFLSDANFINSSFSVPGNYKLISNFVTYAMVPEPSTLSLLFIGLGVIGGIAWRRRFRRR